MMMLGSDTTFGTDQANEIVSAIDSTMTSIYEIKQAKEQYDEQVRSAKLAMQTAKTQAEIARYQAETDYYQYISDSLEEIIERREQIDRNNNINRCAIFGGAIAVSALLVASAYNYSRK